MPQGLLTGVIYSLATGRIRRLVDIGVERDADRLTQHPACRIGPGEGFLAHVSPGDGWEAEPEIQGEISKATKRRPFHLHPSVEAVVTSKAKAAAMTHTVVHDRYVEIDASGNIISVHYADPACGDKGPNGGTLMLHDEADDRWSYDHAGAAFAPPVVTPGKS